MEYKINLKQIVREEIDLAGKYRVWIEMPDGDLQMLKFQEDPIIAEIQPEIDKIIKLKEKELEKPLPLEEL